MILKVTITEGIGTIRCPFPAFTLSEEKNKSAFVHERTEQLKQLEDEGLVSIETVSEKQYKDAVAAVSRKLTKKAIIAKRRSLNRLIKTGGKDKVITGSGLEMTVDPGDATPEEIAGEATQELKELDMMVGDEGKEEAKADETKTPTPPPEHPVDEIGEFLQETGA